jgi:hypothetical protein
LTREWYWWLKQQSNISISFAKVELSNFGPTINLLLLPFLAFQPPFHPDNNAIWRFSQNLMYSCCLPGLKNVVADFLSRPPQQTTGSVAATTAADPVDFEEMAAEQHCCPETQCLLCCTSLKLAFCQTGTQRQAGDVSTGTFHPIVPLNSEKPFLIISTMLLTPGGLPPIILFHPGLCGADFPASSPPGPAGVWPARGARSTAIHAWPPNPSQSLNSIFLTFKWIWWAHCSIVTISIIFLLLLIAHPNGWKLFHFLKRPGWHALKL